MTTPKRQSSAFRRSAIALLSAPCLLAQCALAADLITATITITNLPAHPATLTINASARTWTNSPTASPGTLIQIGADTKISATNLLNHLTAYPQSTAHFITQSSPTNAAIRGRAGEALTVTASSGWASIVYSTQTVTTAYAVRVPISVEVAQVQTNIGSGLVEALAKATNNVPTNAPALANFLGKGASAAQTVTSPVVFYKMHGTNDGVIYAGSYASPILINPTTTNLVNYGNAISSPGTNANSEQFGTDAEATGVRALAVGYRADAFGQDSTAVGYAAQATNSAATAIGNSSQARAADSTAIGQGAIAEGVASTALGSGAIAGGYVSVALGSGAEASLPFSTAIGTGASVSTSNQVAIGRSFDLVSVFGRFEAATITNATLTGPTMVYIVRYAVQTISTLAAGNNTLPALTASHAEITTTASAFTIVGIPAGAAGQIIELVNLTGQNMTIAHESGIEATAGNRILSLSGADRATTANGAARLRYSASQSRWILLDLDP